MPKIRNVKSSLSIENAPVIKKKEDANQKKLGLLSKKKAKNITFRFPLDVIEDLKILSREVSKQVNMTITNTDVVVIAIRRLKKRPSLLTKMIKA